MRMTCCVEYSILQTTSCGRAFIVCTECDNGINECTEGECGHFDPEPEETS